MEPGEATAATDVEPARIIATYELEKHRRQMGPAIRKAFDGGDLEGTASSLREQARWRLIVSLILLGCILVGGLTVLIADVLREQGEDQVALGTVVVSFLLAFVLVAVLWSRSEYEVLSSARGVLRMLGGSRLEPPPLPMEFVRQELGKHRFLLLYAQRMALDRGDYGSVARTLRRRARRSVVLASLGGPLFLWIGLGMPGVLVDGAHFRPPSFLYLALGVYVLDQCLRKALQTLKKIRAVLKILADVEGTG